MSRHTFTSESVTEGHPDKMSDQISDSVLDAVLTEDPYGRVACETLVTTGLCVVAGEISTKAHIDFSRLARDTICEIGYTDAAFGIDGKTCGVIVSIDEQSPDIAMGVDKAVEQRAGGSDVVRRGRRGRPGNDVRLRVRRHRRPHADARSGSRTSSPAGSPRCARNASLDYLRPDGKTQVSVEYENGVPGPARDRADLDAARPEHRHRRRR